MNERQDFIDRLEARIKEWSAQLDGLRETSRGALEGIREGTERAWEDVASSFDDAIERLRARGQGKPRKVVRVDSVMTRGAEVCRRDDPMSVAARILWERDCGCVPVVDDTLRLIGIVTDRDACMTSYFQNRPLSLLRVGDTMSTDVAVCRADDSIESAMERMATRQVRRLPVIDGDGRVIGMLSQNDVIREASRDGSNGKRGRRLRPERVIEALVAIGSPRHS